MAMLTELVLRFDPDQYRDRESASGLAAPFEHEDEDESKILAKNDILPIVAQILRVRFVINADSDSPFSFFPRH